MIEVKHYGSGERVRAYECTPKRQIELAYANIECLLTIAHLDHTPENCDYRNLRALCQKCHNTYDAKHRAETRRKAHETEYGADRARNESNC